MIFVMLSFPVTWNIVAVYLYIFDVSQLANTIIISMFLILKFVSFKIRASLQNQAT